MSLIRNRRSVWQWSSAVAVSIYLWIISISGITFEVRRRLPVLPPEVAQGYMVTGNDGMDSVMVTFSGEGFNIIVDQLLRKPLAIQSILPVPPAQHALPSSETVELAASDVVFGGGNQYSALSTRSFSPGELTFTVDRVTSRDLPVSVTSGGTLPARYYWNRSSLDSVEVRGAASVIAQCNICATQPVIPGEGMSTVAVLMEEGIVYINPSAVSAELVIPVEIIGSLEDEPSY